MTTNWLARLIARIEDVFTISCLVAIAVIINLQIFRRYFLNDPYIWPEEVIRIAMIWLSFVGAGMAFRRGAHILVDTIVNLLPVPVRVLVLDLADLGIILVFVLVGVKAGQLAQIVADAPMPATTLPTSIIVWPLVVLSVQAVAYCAMRIFVRHTRGPEAVQNTLALE